MHAERDIVLAKSLCPSVCPSVRPSIRVSHCDTISKWMHNRHHLYRRYKIPRETLSPRALYTWMLENFAGFQ